MILFKPEHVDLILSGKKTQTRRVGRRRWRVGSVHQARVGRGRRGKPFALLRIISLRQEHLGDITDEDARREGYSSVQDYKTVFERIYGFWEPEMLVWVVDFEVVPSE